MKVFTFPISNLMVVACHKDKIYIEKVSCKGTDYGTKQN